MQKDPEDRVVVLQRLAAQYFKLNQNTRTWEDRSGLRKSLHPVSNREAVVGRAGYRHCCPGSR